jgi:hypothetical protein
MMEMYGLGVRKVIIVGDRRRIRTHPDFPFPVGCNKKGPVTFVDGVSFQVVPMIDKKQLTRFIFFNVIDASAVSCYPQPAFAVFKHTVQVVVTQTVNVVGAVLVTGQQVTVAPFFGTDQSVALCGNPQNSLAVLRQAYVLPLRGVPD